MWKYVNGDLGNGTVYLKTKPDVKNPLNLAQNGNVVCANGRWEKREKKGRPPSFVPSPSRIEGLRKRNKGRGKERY